MTEHEILTLVNAAKKDFGCKCSKYAGAVCAELLRLALARHGITASARDVFIDGVPIEVDLLVARDGVEAKHGLLYRSEDVLALLEIKNSGVFTQDSTSQIKGNFDAIRGKNPAIACMYVTLAELKPFKHAVTTELLGYPAYTLFWRNNSEKNTKYQATGDWDKLIHDLKEVFVGGSAA